MIVFLIVATLTVFVRDSWPLYLFCIGVMLMLAVLAGKRQLDRVSLFPLLIPAFGLWQLALSTTAYAPATRVAALRWFALAGVLMIASARFSTDRERRDRFLDQFVLFAALTSVLCLLQMHSSGGKVLWYFNTGYDDVVYAFFPSRNNYGQFIELALAVALCRAMTDRQRGIWFGLAAALMYASAIASTSRGTAILATLELLSVPAVTLWRSRKSQAIHAGLLYAGVIALALAWTGIGGWDATWRRLSHPDGNQDRRHFTRSAVQMATERPLAGQGLGTFSLVYPKYAKVDTPEVVNYAHNDWVEFAAEGGVLFALTVFALFAQALPRMVRYPWSLGIAFVMVHALFDFPFPRVAVSGWIFALLGSIPADTGKREKGRGWLAPALVAAACAFGVYWSGRVGLAEILYLKDTSTSLRRAIDLAPDESRYYLRLAQLNQSGRVQPMLERAVQLNPWDSGTLIDLGLDAELHEDFRSAEASYLKASRLDVTWVPRWTLANYYFRRSDPDGFWNWAQQAAAVASDRRDLIPLFKLGSQLESEPAAMLKVLPRRGAPLRRYVTYLLETGDTHVLEEAAARLVDCGSIGFDRPYVFWAIEGFLVRHQADPAVHLWSKLKQRGWIGAEAGDAFADSTLESSLDWRFKNVPGVTRSLGGDGRLRLQFSGQQPEETGLVERFVPVRAGVKQRLEWAAAPVGGTGNRTEAGGKEKPRAEAGERARTPAEAGVQWVIQSLKGTVLVSADLKAGGIEFTPGESIVHIRLTYHRAPGTARLTGAVDLTAARVIDAAALVGRR